jgi:hypothetical protein
VHSTPVAELPEGSGRRDAVTLLWKRPHLSIEFCKTSHQLTAQR